jgi:outer membrane receptor protein involved in Fe transport
MLPGPRRPPGAHRLPKATGTLQVQWRFPPGWSFNPGLLYQGPRSDYAYEATTLSRQPATTTLDAFLTYGLPEYVQAGLRLENLTNAAVPYLQPCGYPGAGGNPPLPRPRREVSLRIAFSF